MGLFELSILALIAALPLLVDRYLRGLPEAPSCPTCRSVARPADTDLPLWHWIPALARTFVAECGRCGWRGRMRWRLASSRLRRNRPG